MDLSKVPEELLNTIPTTKPPPGVVSNFINPVSRAAEIQIPAYVFLPLIVGFVALRLYTRVKITGKLGADDFLAVVSAICVIAFCGVVLYLVDGPTGKHNWDVPISAITVPFRKCSFVALPIYCLAALFVKITLLVLYLRIFDPSLRARVMIRVGIVFVVLFYVATAVAGVVLDRHNIQAGFRITKAKANQQGILNVSIVVGLVGVVTDFYILFIPLHLVVGLDLPRARKLGVCSIFLTGLMACICAVVGAYYRFKGWKTIDPLWENIPAYTLSIVELSTGLICSCMPVIFVLFKSMTKSKTYHHVSRYFFTRSSNADLRGGGEDVVVINGEQLPEIPKATMNMRTYIQRMYRSSVRSTVKTGTMRSYGDLSSVSDDYHAQLRELDVVKPQ